MAVRVHLVRFQIAAPLFWHIVPTMAHVCFPDGRHARLPEDMKGRAGEVKADRLSIETGNRCRREPVYTGSVTK